MPQDGGGEHSVISFSGFMNAAKFHAINEVEAYWEAIRAGRLVPRRADIDPRGIERALEYAFILERVAPGIARLRIAGSHLSDLMGMEVRGMPISAFVTPASRNKIGDVLEQVFESPAKATVDLYSESAIGKPEISARLVLLPMKSDLGDISRALGCFATVGEIGRTPRRFEVVDTEVKPLLGDFMAPQTTTEDDVIRAGVTAAPQAGEKATSKGFNDVAARFKSRSGSRTTSTPHSAQLKPGPRPYLSVVTSDKDA
ncbi:PAS domain-containing protein [Pseudooceanicola algae]|uniref:Uncharacterized protein n=1 Tax=Pseudooceanicola algae TaxID=1537215 RepID=A0A418SEI7_9RHOB|nr:PAS domain-containing protein [Pseudooceanicola algae]QPM89740.1 hypothetical protein PSAL_009660 [Pseudooceanicola algae]